MSKKVKKKVPQLRFPEFEGQKYNSYKLSSIACVERGKFTARPRNSPEYYGGSIPFVQTGDIKNSRGKITSYSQTLNQKGLEVSKLFPKGSILLTIAANIGDVAITEIDVACPDSIVVIQVKSNVVCEWLFYHLHTIKNVFESFATQNAQKNINLEVIRPVQVTIPLIAEQEKIASFLGAVDRRLTQLRRKQELLQTYKRGVMQKIFSQEIRFKGAIGSPFPEWTRKKLGNITKICDGTHQTPNYVEQGVPFYSVEHLTSNDFGNTKFISEDVFLEEQKRVCLEKGDILMTRIGDIGTCRLIDWDVKASFYVSLALIKANKITISAFLAHFISSIYFQKELHKRTIHVAFPRKINLGEIGNCNLLVPCLAEQEKIANFLTAIDRKIEALSRQIDQTEQFKKGLLQKLFI